MVWDERYKRTIYRRVTFHASKQIKDFSLGGFARFGITTPLPNIQKYQLTEGDGGAWRMVRGELKKD